MPSLKKAWSQQKWRPLLRWGRMKKVCVDSLILKTVLAFTSLVLHALVCVPLLPDDTDLELRLARFEQLIARRPLLLNSVLLRQNPHNVHEWHKRVKLYEGNPRQVRFRAFSCQGQCATILSIKLNCISILCNLLQIINTYTEAVQTVDPMKATGKPHSLWVSFAKFYEENEQLDDVSHWGLSRGILETHFNLNPMPFLFLICLKFTDCHTGPDNFWKVYQGELQAGRWPCCGVVWIWRDGATPWELWTGTAHTQGETHLQSCLQVQSVK